MTATIHQIGGHRAPSLDPILKLVAPEMNKVNAVILDRMQSEIPLIPELAGHLIAGGGKRMRPMLTLACARLLDYPRRTAPSSWRRRWSLSIPRRCCTTMSSTAATCAGARPRRTLFSATRPAVLVGDFLFSRSFELMVEDGIAQGPENPVARLGGDCRG